MPCFFVFNSKFKKREENAVENVKEIIQINKGKKLKSDKEIYLEKRF